MRGMTLRSRNMTINKSRAVEQHVLLSTRAVHSGNGAPVGLRVRLGAGHSGGGVLKARESDLGSACTRSLGHLSFRARTHRFFRNYLQRARLH